MSLKRTEVSVEGRKLSISNLDKVLYPKTGFTKADVIGYYYSVAPAIIPHLAGRPLTLKRYPDGVDHESFYEKHIPTHAPHWIERVSVPRRARDAKGPTITYPVVNDLPSLIWAANLATIEFHVPMWRYRENQPVPHPDLMVFDLDPGPGTNLVDCCRVSLLLRAMLRAHKLSAVPKTSGKKGLQLYVPLPGTEPWETVSDRAHEIAQQIEAKNADLVVTNMRKDLRRERVLIDWSQNNASKTTIAPYSLRGEAEPSVSTPLSWSEVESGADRASAEGLRFLAEDVLERVAQYGDLMEPLARS